MSVPEVPEGYRATVRINPVMDQEYYDRLLAVVKKHKVTYAQAIQAFMDMAEGKETFLGSKKPRGPREEPPFFGLET